MISASLRDKAAEVTIDRLAEKANLTEFLDREINYGFSGGEK